MKKVVFISLFSFIVVCISFISNSCVDCEDRVPTIRLQNNGTDFVDIQIVTSEKDTLNFNNIAVGSGMIRTKFDPGEIEFTVFARAVSDTVVDQFTAVYCTNYFFEVHPDNSVTRRNFVTP